MTYLNWENGLSALVGAVLWFCIGTYTSHDVCAYEFPELVLFLSYTCQRFCWAVVKVWEKKGLCFV
ncbi:unnamed protein product [Orchesella dallaii]|uniref:Uncharacterized protein n=1 Tax=Orchesella dallaii TaxID=48710 RepID=A0ABP1RRA1_9HEXA